MCDFAKGMLWAGGSVPLPYMKRRIMGHCQDYYPLPDPGLATDSATQRC
jgi:hypothetical protein